MFLKKLKLFFSRFLQLAQERSEVEKLREKVKTLQDKLTQQKQKNIAGDEEGTGTEKPVVEEMITQDRVSVMTVSLQVLRDRFYVISLRLNSTLRSPTWFFNVNSHGFGPQVTHLIDAETDALMLSFSVRIV